jgi:multimeric flavodoxin WrbA
MEELNYEPGTGPLIGRLKSGPVRKVVALDGSPRPVRLSTTSYMLGKLAEGMRRAGAEVDVIELRKKKISGCLGCMHCWTKHPGTCTHHDDMSEDLYPRWKEADLVVYASPVFQLAISSLLKTFIERTLPSLEPWIIGKQGIFLHPTRHEAAPAVVLAVAGMPSMSEFEPISVWARTLLGRYSTLIAEIYRTESELITRQKNFWKVGEVLEATVQAGREIIETGKIEHSTLDLVQQPIIGRPGGYSRLVEVMVSTCLDAGLSPKEYLNKGLRPRPGSIDQFIFMMELALGMALRTGSHATIQFRLQGPEHGSCYFRIAGDSVQGSVGETDSPDLVIEAPFDVWMDIMAGKLDPGQQFMQGRCRAVGDRSLLKLLATTGVGG